MNPTTGHPGENDVDDFLIGSIGFSHTFLIAQSLSRWHGCMQPIGIFLCIVHVKSLCGWRSPCLPACLPGGLCQSSSTSLGNILYITPLHYSQVEGRKKREERREKERSIAPPTSIDQRSVRRAWSITRHAQPLSRWQDPNSQSQQTDEWYDKRMGPQMCLGPLISTRLVIKSADIWVAARANRHSSGWMESTAVEPHRSVFKTASSPVIGKNPERVWWLLGL